MAEDRIYSSDNEYGVPALRKERQPAAGLLLPFDGWGRVNRRRRGVGTWHFYTDDYRFENVWLRPDVILNTLCKDIVEPNFSVFDTTPLAQGLYQIYRKRWLSRFFQEHGLNVYVDLNVARGYREYNLLGVPEGYNAFATRGYDSRIEDLGAELDIAKRISGCDAPNMIVYGGGEKVVSFCLQSGLLHVNDPFNEQRRNRQRQEKEASNG